jgi:acyl dehydratase
MINYQTLKNWSFPDIEHRYDSDDTMFYALSVGLGADPMDEGELRFANDTVPGTPLALPTMAVILGFPGSWMADPGTGIDFPMIVHGEEEVVIHKPIPASGTVISRHRVVRIVDKGQGKGALITYDKDLVDKANGDLLATVTHTTFARGDGGFSARGGVSDSAPPSPLPVPKREPDTICELPTLPQQALLYRLCADRNPLHSEPAVARKGGFDRPILHGLCTYGIAGHALLKSCCDYDPSRLKSLFVRFSSPVIPGDTIRVEMYRDSNRISFRARTKERNRLVLDYGHAQIDF